jgi:hypothetical protein
VEAVYWCDPWYVRIIFLTQYCCEPKTTLKIKSIEV